MLIFGISTAGSALMRQLVKLFIYPPLINTSLRPNQNSLNRFIWKFWSNLGIEAKSPLSIIQSKNKEDEGNTGNGEAGVTQHQL